MALPSTPADTVTYAQALAAGFWGKRTDPAPDQFYTVPGGAVGAAIKLTGVEPQLGAARRWHDDQPHRLGAHGRDAGHGRSVQGDGRHRG